MVKTQSVSIPSSRPTTRTVPGARRTALLAHLREHGGPMSVAEIAAEVGLHPNTVRAHLDRLEQEGKVERATERRGSRGRPRELYSITGAPEPDESYARLAAVLAAQLESIGEASHAIEAGRRWARWEQRADNTPADVSAPAASAPPPAPEAPSSPSTASNEVLTVLRRTGFAPELTADGSILLRHCPFGAIAPQHTDVVCGAHLGLIQGTLDRVSPGTRAELIPFAVPGACVTRLMSPP